MDWNDFERIAEEDHFEASRKYAQQQIIQKFGISLSGDTAKETREQMALRMLNTLVSLLGYHVRGFQNGKIILQDQDTEELYVFLPRWYLPTLDYDAVLYYVSVFLHNKEAFYTTEKGPLVEHPF